MIIRGGSRISPAEETEPETVTIASRATLDNRNRLRWLAYNQDTTVSAIVAKYVERGLEDEDFTGYQPPG